MHQWHLVMDEFLSLVCSCFFFHFFHAMTKQHETGPFVEFLDFLILSGKVLFDGVLHEESSFVGLWQVESWLVTETVFTTL